MRTLHPAKPDPADDGSLRWGLTPHNHAKEGYAVVYGPLQVEVDVQPQLESTSENVYMEMDGGAVRARSCLHPDEAEALAHALLSAAAQARRNAESSWRAAA